jgi:hypothetical protein
MSMPREGVHCLPFLLVCFLCHLRLSSSYIRQDWKIMLIAFPLSAPIFRPELSRCATSQLARSHTSGTKT